MKAILFNLLTCAACGQVLKALDVPLQGEVHHHHHAAEYSRVVCCGNQDCPEYLKGGIANGMVVELQDVQFQLTQ
jgi:hypothetical protein